ncbi:alpha-glucoside-specific PTS transporter subunit IIBC [Catenibacterium mitsuokai]|uniref:alpha-glucoside-specific PTS transporter subunit IIBC n=1 Tax=Catenibacterium mitsuokai TaxID=100886 RepID=UPI000196B011|nr:alpha-glucoside-specific PTS transporter subunit IIBC [Catenibacterium mitsuokai]EEF94699.1 PTS system maltose-specific EIICB component [Catenibacterium mitsuokai DSM 15897]UWO53319.1 alpha-glucoside-specific PTS transporter subunit IIBC [Catenibacterium mitsuokai]
MLQKIQRFGGAMFTPVMLFAFAGVTIGIGTLFTTEAIMGGLADPSSLWYQIWNVILQGGWTVFNQLPLLFVVGLPIGLAKKQQARCCMEALVLYLTFQYFLNTILSQWGPAFGVNFAAKIGGTSGLTTIASIKTLDMGMIGALLISCIVVYLHNKFFDTKLPEWLGTFSGSSFVVIVGFFALLPVAFLSAWLWPMIQNGMRAFQVFVISAGSIGVWIFIFMERVLIPFGLHHLLYFPFFYDSAIVNGGVLSAWAKLLPHMAASTASLKSMAPWAWPTLTGLSKIFGCPGIALAFYATAKKEKKTKIAGLLIPITLTAIFCGITEPIEFTFLFVAPVLFVVHAVLAATLATTAYALGVVGVLSGGLIEMSALNYIPLMAAHWPTYLTLLIVGLAFTGIYFVVFRFLILKFDFKTPGREDDEEITFHSKKEFREKQSGGQTTNSAEKPSLAAAILEGLGGKDNVIDVTNCATRLRVNVKDETLVQSDAYFKSVGAHGLKATKKNIQVIVGLSVPSVREEFESLL